MPISKCEDDDRTRSWVNSDINNSIKYTWTPPSSLSTAENHRRPQLLITPQFRYLELHGAPRHCISHRGPTHTRPWVLSFYAGEQCQWHHWQDMVRTLSREDTSQGVPTEDKPFACSLRHVEDDSEVWTISKNRSSTIYRNCDDLNLMNLLLCFYIRD